MTDVDLDLIRLEIHPAETRFRRNGDIPAVMDFTTVLRKVTPDDDFLDELDGKPTLLGPVVAYLTGFAYLPGYVPGADGYGNGDFDAFDCHSENAAEGYDLLVEERARIEKALGTPDALEMLDGVVFFERGFVRFEYRGRRLLLHLMREAMHILTMTNPLVLLKAHPDGRHVSDADCRRLAKYYQSDETLGLKAVGSRLHPGWLVATCW